MVVKITNLYKSFRNGEDVTNVLYGLNFFAKKGEMIMIMGPSGSGKTTFLNIVGGIDKPDQGLVEIAGRNIVNLLPQELNLYRREMVGFIFQFYNLLPTLTALENVELGIETFIKNRSTIMARATKYLRLVGLDEKRNNFPQELSAGQQQRVAIARALAKEPKIILADEPTGNLDEEREQHIMQLMKKLQHELGITFFIVSHNSRLEQYMDRTLHLRHGKLEEIEALGSKPMITKHIQCPRCGGASTVQGRPGEEIRVRCPQCHLEGVFTFPGHT
jgi:putative ABC transport system ATP-binding protein